MWMNITQNPQANCLNKGAREMKWHIYYIIDGVRIGIKEFQYILDAYNWLKYRCQEKPDGYYFHDLKVICEYY